MTHKERALEFFTLHNAQEVLFQAGDGQCFFDKKQCEDYNAATKGSKLKEWTRDELEKDQEPKAETDAEKEPDAGEKEADAGEKEPDAGEKEPDAGEKEPDVKSKKAK